MRNCDSLIQVLLCIGERLMHPLTQNTIEASSLTPLTGSLILLLKRVHYLERYIISCRFGNYFDAAADPLGTGAAGPEGAAAAEPPAPLPPPPVLRPRPLLGGPLPPPPPPPLGP